MDKCTLQRLQMEILYILYICSSRYCIVPQGLKKLQTEIAAFDKQKTEELDRLEQFREEELRKLRCVSFCPNKYQFSLTVIVTSDFLFRSQGPSALTSHRNDGTVSSNILRLVASLDFPFLLPSFDILRPPNDACLATSTKTGRESREDIINMRVVITLFSVRKLASTFLPRV